jgi:hypothetical protein
MRRIFLIGTSVMIQLRIAGPLAFGLLAIAGGAAWSRPAVSLPIRWSTFRTGRTGYWNARIVYPVFGGPSALARTANATLAAWARSEGERFGRELREQFRSQPRPREPYPFRATPAVSLASPTLISVYFRTEEYTGGAHPGSDFKTMTFGMLRGQPRRLALKDLFLPGADPAQALTPPVLPKLKAKGASEVVDGRLTRLNDLLVSDWVVAPTGLILLFPPYAVGAYAEGAFSVKVDFSELQGALAGNGPLAPLLRGSGRRAPTP